MWLRWQKDGLLRLIDRTTHEQYYEVPITTGENVDAEPTVDGAHRCPGLLGGMEWNGPAYDPMSNTLFVAAVDWCGVFKNSIRHRHSPRNRTTTVNPLRRMLVTKRKDG